MCKDISADVCWGDGVPRLETHEDVVHHCSQPHEDVVHHCSQLVCLTSERSYSPAERVLSQMVAEYARRIYPCETASEVIAMHEASDQVAEMLRKPELAQAFLSATTHEEIKMGWNIVAFGKHKGKTYASVLEDIPYVKDIFDRCRQDNYHEESLGHLRQVSTGFTYGEHLRHLKNYLETIFTLSLIHI